MRRPPPHPLLACQHDAYARSLTTTVLEVLPSEDDMVEVLLEDTVLYPEGGGQPDDHGTVNGVAVRGLRRRAGDGRVYHRLPAAPPLDSVAVVAVDWPRRLDHMQQHTAQHLLSALAAERLGAETTAFHLRPDLCDIDLSRGLSLAEVSALEGWANEAIRAAHPVQARVLADAAALEAVAGGVRSRGLPAGFEGPTRLIEILGLDRNPCGGTHVASTAELQAIVLAPPLSHKGGGGKLRYLAGGRVLAATRAGQARDLDLSRLLSCGPEGHREAIERLQQSAKESGRALQRLQAEVAALAGAALADAARPVLHRADADLAFLRAAAAAATAAAPGRTFLLVGAELFLLAGPPEAVAALGPPVAACLGGRGGGAPGRYQGRFADLKHLDAAGGLLSA